MTHPASLANLQGPRFEVGNTDAVKHGAYSLAAVHPRAQEIADASRPHVPRYTPRLEPLLNLYALNAARVERAHAFLRKHGDWDEEGRLHPIHKRLSTWEAEMRRQLIALAMDNTGRLDRAAARDLARELAELTSTVEEDGDA